MSTPAARVILPLIASCALLAGGCSGERPDSETTSASAAGSARASNIGL
jgi:hypothetical protein